MEKYPDSAPPLPTLMDYRQRIIEQRIIELEAERDDLKYKLHCIAEAERNDLKHKLHSIVELEAEVARLTAALAEAEKYRENYYKELDDHGFDNLHLINLESRAREAETEACAKLVDTMGWDTHVTLTDVAAAIRARSAP